MRYVYIDESGTSAKENVAVVVGVVIHADTQYQEAEEYLEFLRRKFVPVSLQDGFVFHAKEIFPRVRTKEGDPLTEAVRWRILDRVLAAPRKLGIGVVYGYCRKFVDEDPSTEPARRHIQAFSLCLKQAAEFINTHHPGEVATAVAEDVTHMRQYLKKVLPSLREGAPDLYGGGVYHVIRDAVHFTEKKDSPLLQFADHAAFALRRYLAGQEHGERLMKSLTMHRAPIELGKFGGHGFLVRERIT